MQHSQIRSINETVKLFAHKNPTTVQKTLKVLKFQQDIVTDITPAFTVTDLNPGYYSTEIVTPDESCYLLILFCGSPIVLRVGNPPLEFLFYTDPSITVPFTHYDEHGAVIETGNLTELQDGFYFHGPINLDLGYIEVFNRPHILSVPYCDESITVAVAVIWTKRVLKRKFGSKVLKQSFTQRTMKQGFSLNTLKKTFSRKTIVSGFTSKTKRVTFKAKKC